MKRVQCWDAVILLLVLAAVIQALRGVFETLEMGSLTRRGTHPRDRDRPNLDGVDPTSDTGNRRDDE